MRPQQPRLAPLADHEWNAEAAAVMAPFAASGRSLNIFRTLARHPALLRRWLVFANHVLAKNSLPDRDRELAILRIGWLCAAEYEWGQHVLIARDCGISDAELAAVKVGSADPCWAAQEQALLAAVDELHRDACVSDGVWALLAVHYTEQQLLDLVFTTGQYNLVCMALNTLGVPLDEGLPTFAD